MPRPQHPIDLVVGNRLRNLRRSQGLSQSAIAHAIGITFQQLQKYEKGTNRITCGRIWDIANFFGLSVDYFFQEWEMEYNIAMKKFKKARGE